MEIKLSTRAQKYLDKAFDGSLDNAVYSVKSTRTYPAYGALPERTVPNGVRWGIEYPRLIKDSNGCWVGLGKKTALEIGAAIVANNLASIEDLFPNITDYELRSRIYFNQKAREFGYSGPFLQEKLNPRSATIKNKIHAKSDRIAKLKKEIDALELELSNL